MNFNFYELIKLKKDPFYRPIKNLLKFTQNLLSTTRELLPIDHRIKKI